MPRTSDRLAGWVALAVSLAAAGCSPARPLVDLTAAERATLDRKRNQWASEPFGNPDLAAQFYANSRTGPIITRGPNLTAGAREIPSEAYLPALQQMRGMPRYSTADNAVLPSFNADPRIAAAPGAALGTWTNIGPTNQGGRTRSILIHPTSPNIMYAGGVAGGVWKSTDAGANWSTTTDLQMANLAVVSLAFDPANPSVIYAGTGEGFGGNAAVRGAGIFRSTDGGTTWTRLAATATATFHYTMDLVVSPRNSQRLFAATRTGVHRSSDGGATWVNLIASPAGGCTDLAIQRSGAGYIFAACGIAPTPGAAVYRAFDNDGSSFGAILALTGQGRSAIAVAPSDEYAVYVMAAQASNIGGVGRDGLHGVFLSTSNGDPGTFVTRTNGTAVPPTITRKIGQLLLSNPVIALATDCGQGTSQLINQGWYDNVLAVDPVDPNRVWAGGVDLFRSDDAASTWGAAGYWWRARGTDPSYHHADQHAIVFHPQYNGTTNRVMYVGSDGGVDRIDNAYAPVNTTLAQICGSPVAGGPAWIDRSRGYVTTQFYDGVVYPDGQTYFGGLQDNGTLRGSMASGNWTELKGGDGGHVALDTLGDANPGNDVLFLENFDKSIQRSVDGGATFSSVTGGLTGGGFLFIAPFTMNDGFRQNLWTGGTDIWRTTNHASSWARATGNQSVCGLGSVSAIATHPLDPNRVIVGMSDGCYHYNHTALSAPPSGFWPGGGFIASGVISWIAWDPTNINIAYATVSNFGVTNLLKTTNGGVSWVASTGSGATSLPKIPALSVVVSPTDSQQVFVGTDLGVFTSVDAGASWYVENTGFANTPVESLRVTDTAPRSVFAFTHGRGAWRVPLADAGGGGGGGGGGGDPGPQAPANLRVLSIAGTTVTLGWNPPTSGPTPAGYLVEGGLAPGQVLGSLPLGPIRTVSIPLFSGAFHLRVKSAFGGALSAASNEVVAYVSLPVPPSAPANLLGLAAGDTLQLAWTPTWLGGAPTSAQLNVSGTVNAVLPLGQVDTFAYAGVPPGTYTFTVQHINAAGASPPSNAVTLTFPSSCSGVPGTPTALAVSKAGDTLTVWWDPPASGPAPSSYVLGVSGTLSLNVPLAARSISSLVPPGTYNFTVAGVNACGTGAQTAAQSMSVP